MEEITHSYPTTMMPCYGHGGPQGMDPVMMFEGEEEEHGVQQPRVEPEYGGEFNFSELLNIDEQVQMLVQQDPAAFFTNAYPTMPCYGYGPPEDVDPVTMVGGEEERGVQQPRVELEAEHVDGGEFNVEELLNTEGFTNAYPMMMPCYIHGGPQGVDPAMFGGEEEEHDVQQPRIEPEAEHGGDLGGFNLEDLLNTDDWKCFLQMLQAEGEQGQQQPSAERPSRSRAAGSSSPGVYFMRADPCFTLLLLFLIVNTDRKGGSLSLIVNVHLTRKLKMVLF